MKPSVLHRASLILLAACASAGLAGAQSSSTPASPSSQDSSQQQAPAPAKSTASEKDQATEKKKPKKVWTNEEISSVKGTISVVGDSSSSGPAKDSRQSQAAEAVAKSEDAARGRQLANYRNQILGLRNPQEAIDKKIAELRNFKAENSSSSGGIDIRHGYSMTPVADQIAQLEDKKKQIQAKIDNLEDEARKNGIEPGELR